jgi:2-oxoglutarate dehydrogenase E2 component (dihydrolipoamide succinyltransferase)
MGTVGALQLELANYRRQESGVLVEVRVPPLAESVPDASLLEWRVKEGDRVKRGANLIDLETDKVTLEVTATADAVVKQLVKQPGDRVLANELIALLDTEASVTVEPKSASVESPKTDPAVPKIVPTLSPAVRKLVADHELDPNTMAGTGKGGRLTKEDVLARIDAAPSVVTTPASAAPIDVPSPASVAMPGLRNERRTPMSRLRQTAAQRLLTAQHEHAILTTFNDVNMAPVNAVRERYRQAFEQRYQVRLGIMAFCVSACVRALQRFPVVNACIEGNDMVYHDYCDIGIAVASARGLVVPVVRDAESKSFPQIEQEIRAFGERANAGKLRLEDLTGGTFSITNGGVFGSLLSTPILNPPQSAILGMHKIQERPVAEQGQVVIRPMMYLALSYDHRLIDGRDAVQFLVAVKESLEDPVRLLIEV